MTTSSQWQHRQDEADTGEGWTSRTDRGELMRPHIRADGTMLVEGFAARAGILEYRDRDGLVTRELVTAEVLRDAAHGLARAPVTLEHPDEDVTPDNVGKLGVGDTDGDVEVSEGGFVKVRLAIRRADAIKAVRAGKVELSPGYTARIDSAPGVDPEHGAYDARQLERRYNHLAIVDRARGGHTIKLRADGVATETLSTPGVIVNPKFLRLLTLLGVTSRIDSDDAAIDAAAAVVEANLAAASTVKSDLAESVVKADTEAARADAAEAKVTALEAEDVVRADAAERTTLEAVAKLVDVDPAKHSDTADLRRAIASSHLGSEVKADASDDYVRALVDLAAASKRTDSEPKSGMKAWEGQTKAKTDSEARKSPAELSRSRYDDAFNATHHGVK